VPAFKKTALYFCDTWTMHKKPNVTESDNLSIFLPSWSKIIWKWYACMR